MIRTTIGLITCALVTSGMLAGCSIVPKADPPAVYQLATAGTNIQPGQTSLPFGLTVNTPQSNRVIDSTRILVQPAETRLSAYKGARWSDTVPAMLRDQFTEALRQTSALQAVSNDSLSYRTDIALGTEVMTFQITYQPSEVKAVVILDAFLSESKSLDIVAAQRFKVEQTLADTTVDSAVQALSTASNQLTEELVQWTLRELAAYQPGKPGN